MSVDTGAVQRRLDAAKLRNANAQQLREQQKTEPIAEENTSGQVTYEAPATSPEKTVQRDSDWATSITWPKQRKSAAPARQEAMPMTQAYTESLRMDVSAEWWEMIKDLLSTHPDYKVEITERFRDSRQGAGRLYGNAHIRVEGLA
jgi:hypothetical protein